MIPEHDEAMKHATCPSVGDAALGRAIEKVIQTTRRHWAIPAVGSNLAAYPAIGAGMRCATLTCDGEVRYQDRGPWRWDPMTVVQAEKLAAKEPTRDWRIHLLAQLEHRHYRRESDGRWVLYERGYRMPGYDAL